MNPLFGVLLIAIGSMGAASFYVPINKVKEWSWENFWVFQSIMAYLLAPFLFAWIMVPDLFQIFSLVPAQPKFFAVLFGFLWGFGGLTFGLSMRYLGVGLGQSVALGFCTTFGTLIPPLVVGKNFFSPSGLILLIGVAITITGIAIVGYAGFLKTKDLPKEEQRKAVKEFALKKGIFIAVFSGIMSAMMNFGLNGLPGFMDAGNIFQEVARAQGVNKVLVTTPGMVYVLFGGFITNFSYCVILNIKNKSYQEFTSVSPKMFINNVFFSMFGGVLWYMQFFFFGMGQSYLPPEIRAFGWSILMALNIAFSNIWGLFILKEWEGVSKKTIRVLVAGILVLILSTLIIKL
jgi:L-rhamnose-H+ transport protein